jgi:hypothetical protein
LDLPGITDYDIKHDDCNYNITFTSTKGCPVFKMAVFNDFINYTSYFWGTFFVVTGSILALTGIRYDNLAYFYMISLGTFGLIGLLGFDLFLNQTDDLWL